MVGAPLVGEGVGAIGVGSGRRDDVGIESAYLGADEVSTTVAFYGEIGARRGVSNGTSWRSPGGSAATATKRG
jgi:hypothetical protein